jgi:DNA gyrase inhibitor GyrI
MAKFFVKRTQVIDSPLADCAAAVRDFQRWPGWSPWLIAEPDAELTFSEDGNAYSWKGKVTGAGSIQVRTDELPRHLSLDLEFLEPFKSKNQTGFTFKEVEGGTEVTWTMEGKLPWFLFFLKKIMAAWIGNDYQRGLLLLKDYVETGEAKCKLDFIGEETIPGFYYVGIRTETQFSKIGPAMEADLEKLINGLREAGMTPSAPPFSIYHKLDFVKDWISYTVGIPVEKIRKSSRGTVSGEFPDTRCYVIEMEGRYEHLGSAWSAGYMRGKAKVFNAHGQRDNFEIYVSDPENTPEDQLITRVCFPVR